MGLTYAFSHAFEGKTLTSVSWLPRVSVTDLK
ncbi:hypothetical protein STAFG_7581 [Streptomyces afghaniensis 772]|uniref:Uncharacterized protein n=1 Tax=Streptomyces afghaniensis 772 TaxID=1283301 RepID=S4M7W0_9ACTN|nr:hypothetical protein STAFG_7581 [Streptomyces afghaniensis 772]